MMPLFEKKSLVVLESLSFTKTLYAFDFDGTLAKIVSSPSAAEMSKTTELLLNDLSQLAPVAIVSGRSVEDLKQRLKFQPPFLIGNHGLEGIGSDGKALLKAKKICSQWLAKISKVDFLSGIEVEAKTFSIALHYRKARQKSRAKEQLVQLINELVPLPRVVPGKSILNILPPDAPHKGIAVLDLMKKTKLKHALYIGDDETDEDVFSMPYTAGQLLKIRVGKKRTSQADYFIERQSEINLLLKTIINFYKYK